VTPDERIVLALLAAFATFVTAHAALVFGLAARPPRWRAFVALVLVPLAPYWGVRAGMYLRSALWGVGALAYLALRVIASR
jgi:hypothetical protein